MAKLDEVQVSINTSVADGIKAMHDIVRQAGDVQLLHVDDIRVGGSVDQVTLASVPEGRELVSLRPLLDEFRDHPERRTGEAMLSERDSFIRHVNRFQTPDDTAIFADPSYTKPSFLAVYDYHQPIATGDVEGKSAVLGKPGWCGHRARFACRMSDEWLAWQAANGKTMTQGEFAEFLEDRIQDVRVIDTAQDPKLSELVELLGGRVGGSAAIMKLSRGLSVSRNIKVRNAQTLATGEVNVQFEEQHADESGAPITTPNLFFIGIPIFYAGEAYRIPVKLRYRFAADGKLLWSIHLHRPDLVFEDAFSGLRQAIATATACPIMIGTPER